MNCNALSLAHPHRESWWLQSQAQIRKNQPRLRRLPAQPGAGWDALQGALGWEETWVLHPALPVPCYETPVESFCVPGLLFVMCKTVWVKWSLRSLPAMIFNNLKLLKKHKQEMKVLARQEEKEGTLHKNRGSHEF